MKMNNKNYLVRKLSTNITSTLKTRMHSRLLNLKPGIVAWSDSIVNTFVKLTVTEIKKDHLPYTIW